MKPVIRWTIGNVGKFGFKSLIESIKTIKLIYRNEFDLYVCYNVDSSKINFLEELGVKLISQENSNPFPNVKCFWKLCPPRINFASHEIFIDNDLVITKRMPKLEEFLSAEDKLIYTQGFCGYGRFWNYNTMQPCLNSGLFGIPPRFDFATQIFDLVATPLTGYFDEQGLVAAVFSKNKNKKICITLNEIGLCRTEDVLPPFIYGCHFAGINKHSSKGLVFKKFMRGRIKI